MANPKTRKEIDSKFVSGFAHFILKSYVIRSPIPYDIDDTSKNDPRSSETQRTAVDGERTLERTISVQSADAYFSRVQFTTRFVVGSLMFARIC